MYYLITRNSKGQFERLNRWRYNPILNWKDEEIKSRLREKYGAGWYRIFKPEQLSRHKVGSTTIWVGWVR